MAQAKSYKAPFPVTTVEGEYVKAGDVIVTAGPKGEGWETISQAEKAGIEAAQNIPGDPPLESLSLEALRAVAVTENVNPTGLSKKELIAAIKAANEPRL